MGITQYFGTMLFSILKRTEASFPAIFMEMIAIDLSLKNIKEIGTDMEMAIYNGFSAISEKLQLLICVFHLKRKDEKKLSKLCNSGERLNKEKIRRAYYVIYIYTYI